MVLDPSLIGTQQQSSGLTPQPQPQDNSGDLLGGIGKLPGEIAKGFGDAVGSIPVVGKPLHELLNLPGDVAGWGAHQVADSLGAIGLNIGDGNRASMVNVGQYGSDASGAMKLIQDTPKIVGSGQLAAQFNALGEWQKANDPQSYQMWQEAKAQADQAGGAGLLNTGLGTRAGEVYSGYLRSMVSAYSDKTPEGYQGWMDLMPELALAQGGSVGQTLTDGLSTLMYGQKAAERSIAVNIVNRVEDLRKADPSTLSDVERQARYGIDNMGWTNQHAANYLVIHGQGLSHDAATELIASVGLDPLFWAQISTGGALSVAEKGAAYGSEEMAAAIAKMPAWRQAAARIGTTTASVLSNPAVNKTARIANNILNFGIPLLGGGERGAAAKQVLANVSADAFHTVHIGGILDASRRAESLGIGDQFQKAIANSAANQGLSAAFANSMEGMAKAGELPAVMGREDVGALAEQFAKDQGKDLSGRVKGYMERNKEYNMTGAEQENLAQRYAVATKQTPEKAAADIAGMSDSEKAIWHDVAYRMADESYLRAAQTATSEEWGSLARVKDQIVLGNTSSLVTERANEIIQSITDAREAAANSKSTLSTLAEAPNGTVRVFRGHSGVHADAMTHVTDGAFGRGVYYTVDHGYATDFARTGKGAGQVGSAILDNTKIADFSLLEERETLTQAIDGLRELGDPATAADAQALETMAGYLKLDPSIVTAHDFLMLNAREPDRFAEALAAAGKGGFHYDTNGWRSVGAMGEQGTIVRDTSIIKAEHANVNEPLAGNSLAFKMWNQAAAKYPVIDDIMGRIPMGATQKLDEAIGTLRKMTENGALHRSLDPQEFEGLPKAIKEVLSSWVDETGKPLWELAFRPADEIANGLGYDAGMRQYVKFAPNLPHIFEGMVPVRTVAPIADALGRLTGGHSAALTDALQTAWTVAKDAVSGERLMQNMEQRFVKRVSDRAKAGGEIVPEAASKLTFQAARDAARGKGITAGSIGGLGPDQWWEAASPTLQRYGISEAYGKREMFQDLMSAAEGDFSKIGLSSGGVQRLRTFFIAAGLDPNNATGMVTVGLYNAMRYAGNITFAIQAVSDAPWFSIMHGIMPVGRVGKALESPEFQKGMAVIEKMGDTGLFRQASLDFTERAAVFGVREGLEQALFDAPVRGKIMENTVGNALGRVGGAWQYVNRQALATQIKMAYTDAGRAVFDSLRGLQTKFEAEIEKAPTEEGKALWGERLSELRDGKSDVDKMLLGIRGDLSLRLGRMAKDEEVGLEYLTQIMDDSRLEQRTGARLIDNSKIITTAEHATPPSVGKLAVHNLDEVVARAGIQGINNEVEMRVAMGSMDRNAEELMRAGLTPKRAREVLGEVRRVDGDELRTRLVEQGVDPEQADRMVEALGTNWQRYLNKSAVDMGMTRLEMLQVQDYISAQAKRLGMNPTEYLSQGMTANGVGGVDGAMHNILQAIRLTGNPETNVVDKEALSKYVSSWADTLHPSAQDSLVENWRTVLPRQIGDATTRGDTAAAMQMQRNLDMLDKGWSPNEASDQLSRDLQSTATAASSEALPETIADYEAKYGKLREGNRATPKVVLDPDLPEDFRWSTTGFFGENLRAAAPEVQQEIVSRLSRFREEFPNVPMGGIEIEDFTTPHPGSTSVPDAVTSTWTDENPTVTLNEHSGWQNDPALRERARERRRATEAPTSRDLLGGIGTKGSAGQMDGVYDLPHRTSPEVTSDVYHELGHVTNAHIGQISDELQSAQLSKSATKRVLSDHGIADKAAFEDLLKFRQRFVGSEANRQLTSYSGTNFGEAMAELHAQAFNPELAGAVLPKELQASVDEYKGLLQKNAIWKPSESVAARDASLYTNADITRIRRDFGGYLDSLDPKSVAGENVRAMMKDVPREQGVPYNYTHATIVNAMHGQIVNAQRDAFRLANIQLERSVAQRSLNHPIFGLYPTSYMWGKVLPETVKFIAKTPFGLGPTGAGLTALHDVMSTIGTQQDYDPSIKQLYDKVGKSAVYSLLSYLSPGATWDDMQGKWPIWLRETAAGKDWKTITKDQLDVMSPERWVQHWTSAIPEVAGGVGAAASGAAGAAAGVGNALAGIMGKQTPQAPAQPTGAPALTQPVAGAALQGVLSDQMNSLQDILFR